MVPVIIETLGDLQQSGMGLSVSCDDDACGRQLATLPDLLEAFGPDQPYVGNQMRVRCKACGSRRYRLSVISNSIRAAGGSNTFRSTWGGMPER